MIPIGGLSLITHSLILFGGFLKKLFKIQTFQFKGKFLRFGLKSFPKFSLALFAKDSSLKLVFSCLIISVIFCLTLISAGMSFKFNSGKSTNVSSVAALIKTGFVFAMGKSSLPENDSKLKEVPFAREIREAEPDLTAKSNLLE